MTVESGPTPWRGYDTVSADPDELDRGAEFDVVVVGAGLVGLATAREILRRQPETSIAILDGVAPAAGASGRGTGLVGPGSDRVSMSWNGVSVARPRCARTGRRREPSRSRSRCAANST